MDRHTQRLRDALANADGFDALEVDSEAHRMLARATVDEQMEMARKYAECFNTDAGHYVLNDLIARLLFSPVVTPESTQFEAGIREGQNSLVRELITLVDLSETGGHTE